MALWILFDGGKKKSEATVKIMYNDNPWEPKYVAVVDRWSLFISSFML